MKNFINSLKIRKKMGFLMVVFIAGLASVMVITITAINKVKVNGPIYGRIVEGKDLVADILPPPEYIIESYLVAYQMAEERDPARLKFLLSESERLKKEYDQRHEFWTATLEHGQMRQVFLEESYKSAVEFYRVRDAEFIPAVKAGNKAAIAAAMARLGEYYTVHRAAIDKVVSMANERNSRDEVNARGVIRGQYVLLATTMALFCAFLVSLTFALSRSMGGVMEEITALTKEIISKGNFNVDVPREYLLRQDEAGDMSRSINELVLRMRGFGRINEVSSRLMDSTHSISSASNQIADGASQQSAGYEEMSGSIQSVASQAAQASDLAKTSASDYFRQHGHRHGGDGKNREKFAPDSGRHKHNHGHRGSDQSSRA